MVVVTETPGDSAATTVVCGSSFYFSSVAITALAVAATIAANHISTASKA